MSLLFRGEAVMCTNAGQHRKSSRPASRPAEVVHGNVSLVGLGSRKGPIVVHVGHGVKGYFCTCMHNLRVSIK
jgi:hypothetical protein